MKEVNSKLNTSVIKHIGKGVIRFITGYHYYLSLLLQ